MPNFLVLFSLVAAVAAQDVDFSISQQWTRGPELITIELNIHTTDEEEFNVEVRHAEMGTAERAKFTKRDAKVTAVSGKPEQLNITGLTPDTWYTVCTHLTQNNDVDAFHTCNYTRTAEADGNLTSTGLFAFDAYARFQHLKIDFKTQAEPFDEPANPQLVTVAYSAFLRDFPSIQAVETGSNSFDIGPLENGAYYPCVEGTFQHEFDSTADKPVTVSKTERLCSTIPITVEAAGPSLRASISLAVLLLIAQKIFF